jgi:hypothetical protein
MRPPDAERATTIAGLVTLGIGAALTVAPDRAATALGLGDHPRLARVIGIADLGLAPGLLGGRPRWPWMGARAMLNLLIAGHYHVESRDGSGHSGAEAGAAAMAVLTGVDAALTVSLQKSGR